MIRKYVGVQYSFEVDSQPYKEKFTFVITATHKESQSYSRINLLDQVHIEFEIGEGNPLLTQSEWLVTKRESRDFLGIATRLFTDNKYLRFFEGKLDEHRKLVTWEKVKQPRNQW